MDAPVIFRSSRLCGRRIPLFATVADYGLMILSRSYFYPFSLTPKLTARLSSSFSIKPTFSRAFPETFCAICSISREFLFKRILVTEMTTNAVSPTAPLQV